MKKRISLLGSTGSIGTQTLDIVRMHPEKYQITALTAGKNLGLLESQIREFRPAVVVMSSKEDADRLKANIPSGHSVYHGIEGIKEAVSHPDTDLVLNALVGSMGLTPTYFALKNGKDVALANKESLVTGGKLVMQLASDHGVNIIPVDSEHSAVFQCLMGEKHDTVKRIVLTASGGPFRQWTREAIEKASYREALNHPNWSMGRKITIDSATMMNKGLEIIEAAWLFRLKSHQIDVLVHPQSIIHSMVEFCDTSVIAQLGLPDMRLPIQYALAWPERIGNQKFASLMLDQVGALSFEKPDSERFPCLALAKEALKIGKTMPCVLNAANDILVEAFLQERIRFYDISQEIERLMGLHKPWNYNQLEDLLEVEAWVKSTLKAFN